MPGADPTPSSEESRPPDSVGQASLPLDGVHPTGAAAPAPPPDPVADPLAFAPPPPPLVTTAPGAISEHAWEERWPPTSYWVKTTAAVVLTIAVLYAANAVRSIFVLVLIAAVIAVGLEPAVSFLMARIRVSRGAAVAIIFLVALAIVGVFAALIGPLLVRQIQSLSSAVPDMVPKLARRSDWIGHFVTQHQLQIQHYIASIPERVTGSFGTVLGLTGKVSGFIFNFLTVMVLTIFFMASLPALRRSATLVFHPHHRGGASDIIAQSVDKISGYVSGNIITSLICGVFAGIALLIIGVPYAIPLAMWAGMADLIPSVGAYLGAIPPVLIAFTQSPVTGLVVVGYFVVYQQFENYVLVPRIMKNAVDLSPAAVLVSTLVGASLAGFAGALLALPVAATIKVVLREAWYEQREEAARIAATESSRRRERSR